MSAMNGKGKMLCWLIIAQSNNTHLLCLMVSVSHAFTQGTVRTNYLHSTTCGASAVNHQTLGAGIIIELAHSVSGGCCWLGAWLGQSAGRPSHAHMAMPRAVDESPQHGGWVPKLRGERESNKEKERSKSYITLYNEPHQSQCPFNG